MPPDCGALAVGVAGAVGAAAAGAVAAAGAEADGPFGGVPVVTLTDEGRECGDDAEVDTLLLKLPSPEYVACTA